MVGRNQPGTMLFVKQILGFVLRPSPLKNGAQTLISKRPTSQAAPKQRWQQARIAVFTWTYRLPRPCRPEKAAITCQSDAECFFVRVCCFCNALATAASQRRSAPGESPARLRGQSCVFPRAGTGTNGSSLFVWCEFTPMCTNCSRIGAGAREWLRAQRPAGVVTVASPGVNLPRAAVGSTAPMILRRMPGAIADSGLIETCGALIGPRTR